MDLPVHATSRWTGEGRDPLDPLPDGAATDSQATVPEASEERQLCRSVPAGSNWWASRDHSREKSG